MEKGRFTDGGPVMEDDCVKKVVGEAVKAKTANSVSVDGKLVPSSNN
jgi:hypothetical protein